jgi:hypothetical protein
VLFAALPELASQSGSAGSVLHPALSASAQGGNAGVVHGTVTDPSGAVISNATVHITNTVSGFDRTASTDALGQFGFSNVPFNPYRIEVSANGFAPLNQKVEIRSSVGTSLTLILQVAGASQTVTVESGGDLIEDDPTFHTDVDRSDFMKVPLESQSSSLSSLVTLSTPGVAADSNGLFHGLGDHASNSFNIDGQSITDQQSKVFSNQLPSDSIQSIEVISGAPPAEFGGKTSLVIVATTRSGEGVTTPTGDVNASYGAFGSSTGGFDLSYGGKSWGNFIEADVLDTGRFLDPPEFTVFHDKGNEENIFDRIDYSFDQADSVHLDLNYSRSWFQTPNAFQNLNVQNVINGTGVSASPAFGNVGNTDQASKINTLNISPTYTRVISNNSVRSPIWGHPTCKPPRSPSTVPSPTPAFTPITPMSKASITSRPASNTSRPSCASTTAWASSTTPTTRPASTRPPAFPCRDTSRPAPASEAR